MVQRLLGSNRDRKVYLIAALVVIRLMIQFLAQTVGVIVLRVRRPDLQRPFKMWLYPLPAIIALVGFLYVLIMRKDFTKEIQYGAVILVLGVAFYFLRYQVLRMRTSNANPPF